MISFEEIKAIYNKISLEELVNSYDRRQYENERQDCQQFCAFLEQLNKQLSTPKLLPFYKNILIEIVRNINKKSYDENLIGMFLVLQEISKPKTTDRKILSSVEWQMEQTLSPSLNELPYEEKFEMIFHIIFSKFDLKVQKQFLKLLKSFHFNSSMDLLELMTFVINYHNGKIDMEQLENDLEILVTINEIIKNNSNGFIADTSYGKIPLSYANECLGITDTSMLTLGNCHFAVSHYLKQFPELYGAYYYIPNYFKGFIEHSVLIDYNKNYVYDLSHNIALPLEYFSKYYQNLSFVISGFDFIKLDDMVEKEYGYSLCLHHIEEVRRQLKK